MTSKVVKLDETRYDHLKVLAETRQRAALTDESGRSAISGAGRGGTNTT